IQGFEAQNIFQTPRFVPSRGEYHSLEDAIVGSLKQSLNSVLFRFKFSTIIHVLILGTDKAGKTTLLERIKSVYSNIESLPSDRIIPTVGLNIDRIEAANRKL
ncbi:hypothetical protein S83_038799, partial [Arachis hypogaea]